MRNPTAKIISWGEWSKLRKFSQLYILRCSGKRWRKLNDFNVRSRHISCNLRPGVCSTNYIQNTYRAASLFQFIPTSRNRLKLFFTSRILIDAYSFVVFPSQFFFFLLANYLVVFSNDDLGFAKLEMQKLSINYEGSFELIDGLNYQSGR